MATVEVEPDKVVIRLSTGERLMALRRHDIEIPLANVSSVSKVTSSWSALGCGPPYTRKRGSFTPAHVIGSWRRPKGPFAFAAIKRNAPGYVIKTTGEPFDLVAFSAPEIAELEALVAPES